MHSLEERENNCVFAIEQIYHKNSFRESKKKKKEKNIATTNSDENPII